MIPSTRLAQTLGARFFGFADQSGVLLLLALGLAAAGASALAGS